jgi:hypothetical protein
MTKAQLLAQLSGKYLVVDTPVVQQTAYLGVIWYRVSFFETGKYSDDSRPTGLWNSIDFYVYHESLGDEAAYYLRQPEVPEANQSLVVTSSLDNINKIYQSGTLRARVQGAMLVTSFNIRNESVDYTNHAQRAKLASDMSNFLQDYIGYFMAFISQDAAVQAAGGAVSDSTLQNLVDSNIDWMATTLFQA